MGLLAVHYIIFYEVKMCKFIMTVCGPDCQKGGLPVSHYHIVTGSVTQLWLLWAVSLELSAEHLPPSSEKIKNELTLKFITILHLWWRLESIWNLQECVRCCSALMLRSLHQVLTREAVSRRIILNIYLFIYLFCFFVWLFTVGCRTWVKRGVSVGEKMLYRK